MKKHLIFWTLAVIALSSCGKINSDGLYPRAYGDEVVFSLSNTSSPLKTKAEYSGDIDDNDIERIDWVEGEQISIACAQTENNFFNYTVASVQTDGHESEASVTHDPGESGLCWKGDDTYNFYAVSPYSSTLTMNGVAVFDLPTAQSFDSSKSGWNTGHSNFKAAVSPAYMQMTAKQSVIKSGDDPSDPVDLPFMILPTVLEFTLSGEADMVVDQVKLESSSTPLTGQYQVYIDQNESAAHPEYPRIYIQRPEDVTKSASMVLRESGEPVEVKTGEDITFTFMLLPTDIKDLTFFLTRRDAEGTPYTFKTRLSYANGETLKFDAHKKYLIKGMVVPEGAKWTINYDPVVVTSWYSGVEEDLELEAPGA